jgi:hypothetical protein
MTTYDQGPRQMKASPQPKSNHAVHGARKHHNQIVRRAAAIKGHWSARERNERATMAGNLQRLLAASIVASLSESRAA